MSKSTWKEIGKPEPRPALKEDISTDIAIVGGGLAGVILAYLLSKEGEEVTLVEKKSVGSGATEYTTAFLMQDIDTELQDLVRMFGTRKARLIWQSHRDAIEAIHNIVRREDIDCEFMRTDGYLYANDDAEWKVLKREHRIAERLGFETYLRDENDLPFLNEGYLRLPDQGKFHPLKFLYALSDRAVRSGARIFERTEVMRVAKQKDGWRLETPRGNIRANKVVLATYYPLGNPKQTLLKKGMYVSYIVEAKIPKEILPEAVYLDMMNPYHYFRVDRMGESDRLILGGADHRAEIKMNPTKNFRALEDHMREKFGDLPYVIEKKWSGPILEPSDGLALIGEVRENEYVATAFSGNGMTYSMISGILLRDLLVGRKNQWRDLYDPKRLPTAKSLLIKGRDYGEELFAGAVKNAVKYRKL
jgi:glycine/D-amino acid oxidase-like deaminating enzyme